jgi:thiamine-phosphate diphosphorylase
MSDDRTPQLSDRLAVYLVADPDQTARDIVGDVEHALAGGATAVQLRAKRLSDRPTLELARALAARCRSHGALFLVNDRVDIALAADADGVHLGVDDLPLEAARHIGGPDLVIGYSPETDQQARNVGERGANYLGVGPIFATVSKSDAGEPIGLDILSRRLDLAGLPTIGIGGITAVNAGQVIGAGAVGVAVVGAVLRSVEPRQATFELAAAVRVALANSGRRA